MDPSNDPNQTNHPVPYDGQSGSAESHYYEQPSSTESDYYEQLRLQQAQEDAERLRKEKQRIQAAQRQMLFARIVNSIYFLVGLLEVLLGIRFLLRLSGANPDNPFAQTIYSISAPFVAPFSTLFISPTENIEATLGENIFDLNLLIAMLIYALLCVLGVWSARYIQQQIGDPDPYV